MRRILILAIAASLVPASAGATTEEVTEIVSYKDLDLHDPQDVRALEERIAAAVIKVCGEAVAPTTWAVREVEECRSAASDDAKAQLEERLASLTPLSVAAVD